ncbi:Vesicle-associated protein 4-1 [Salvia divinorum]|uniref:Vesicle-associated protein 4-1 n=1 Tax=Salvia divinorum TaxID=28513 RepID=A0ABD1IH22_SALDI
MATVDNHRHKKWRIFPFWQSGSSPSSTHNIRSQSRNHGPQNGVVASNSRSFIARLLFPGRRRLRLDPSNKLYFPYEPGKQGRSAVRIKNSSNSHVAFKFQTTAPKSCYMRPPGGILAPGESLIATVFKFMELPENNGKNQKRKAKFKIISLKVKQGTDYVPELFDEQRDEVVVERVLHAVFLDPERPNPALEKLKRQLAEADAATETRKKPPADAGPKMIGEGLVIDEWKERREKYLARQRVQAVDSV